MRTLSSTALALAFTALLVSAQPPQTPARPRPASTPAPAPAATPAASPRDLKYPPLRAIEPPKAATFTLPNGMKLLLIEDHELATVGGEARVRVGNLFDPADKVGLAALTGMAMRGAGTRELTGEQLDGKLERLAASVDSAIAESAGAVSFSSLVENSGEVLTAFRDVLTAPAFRADRVDLAKIKLRGMVAHRNDDPGEIVVREFPGIVYGRNTPYGREMEHDGLDRIARADLQAFHRRYFFPKNVTLAVWGDFETAKMKDRLEQLFAGWTVEQPAVAEFPAAAAKPAPGVYLAKIAGAQQTHFAIGHLGGRLDDKDYPALTVMADVLAGGISSRLFQELALRMGNVYSISAEWGAGFDHPGLFRVSGSAKPLGAAAALHAIQKELERIRSAEVTDDELRAAKDAALDRLALDSATRRNTFDRILDYEYFGYPAGFLQQFQKALAAVTRADVLRVAKAHLRPAELTAVVAGDPEDLPPSLDNLGLPVRDIDLTIAEPKARAVPADPASLERGKQLLARLQRSVGGADKLAAVRDYTEVLEVRFAIPAGGETITETDRWMAPGNLREDADRAGIKSALYTDGKSGWSTHGRSSGVLSGPGLEGARGDLFRSYFAFLLSDRATGTAVAALDPDTLEIAGADGLTVRVSVDPDSGLPVQFSFLQRLSNGPPALVQETFSEFGEVAGVRVPFRISTLQNGNLVSESSVKDFKVNSGLLLSDLERRP